jgi:hypothetical protein
MTASPSMMQDRERRLASVYGLVGLASKVVRDLD